MIQLEQLGYLKMDFLGLRTLTVIKDAVKNVKDSRGIDVDIDHIDLDDQQVLGFIGTGKTDGVFQLESSGMQSFMKELKPSHFEDIIAGISLYRPGPMDFIPAYIKGKKDPAAVVYKCKALEPILKDTYGCIVYQEQVMQIVQRLAGYSMGQADIVRRAMSKKHQDEIDAGRHTFVYGNDIPEGEKGYVPGCIKNHICDTDAESERVANEIYDSMIDFAKYAFNKSHAACYAVLSMQTAWLKFYYPPEYMVYVLGRLRELDDPCMTGFRPVGNIAFVKHGKSRGCRIVQDACAGFCTGLGQSFVGVAHHQFLSEGIDEGLGASGDEELVGIALREAHGVADDVAPKSWCRDDHGIILAQFHFGQGNSMHRAASFLKFVHRNELVIDLVVDDELQVIALPRRLHAKESLRRIVGLQVVHLVRRDQLLVLFAIGGEGDAAVEEAFEIGPHFGDVLLARFGQDVLQHAHHPRGYTRDIGHVDILGRGAKCLQLRFPFAH